MRHQGIPTALVAAAIALESIAGARAASSSHKLIEWGFDQPNTMDVRKNIAKMEERPFDGLVIAAHVPAGQLEWTDWSHKAYTRADFQPAVDDLKNTEFHKFTDNFLRFNATPADVNWFDEAGWKAIVANAAVAGWICQEGGLKGLMFDTEPYKAKIFTYKAQKGSDTISLEKYSEEVRLRGKQFAQALAREKPDITVMFTFATSVRHYKPQTTYMATFDLLPSFIDGFLEGIGDRARVVDGLEMAYGRVKRSEFDELHTLVRNARAISDAPDIYDNRLTVGYGIWLDCAWRERGGWFPDDPDKNLLSPAKLKSAVTNALEGTDKYVWLYSESVDWWTGKGLTFAYIKAVTDGRATANASARLAPRHKKLLAHRRTKKAHVAARHGQRK